MPDPDQGRKPNDQKHADAKRKEAQDKGSKRDDKKDKKDENDRSERRSQH